MRFSRHFTPTTEAGRDVLIAVTAGALLRFTYLDYGLPELMEEATPVRQAWEMWNWDGAGFDFNPHFFNYPSFYFYLQWVAQAAYYLLGSAFGAVIAQVS